MWICTRSMFSSVFIHFSPEEQSSPLTERERVQMQSRDPTQRWLTSPTPISQRRKVRPRELKCLRSESRGNHWQSTGTGLAPISLQELPRSRYPGRPQEPARTIRAGSGRGTLGYGDQAGRSTCLFFLRSSTTNAVPPQLHRTEQHLHCATAMLGKPKPASSGCAARPSLLAC